MYQRAHQPHLDWLTLRFVLPWESDDAAREYDRTAQLLDDARYFSAADPQALSLVERKLVARGRQDLSARPPERLQVGQLKFGKASSAHLELWGEFFRIDELNPALDPLRELEHLERTLTAHLKATHLSLPRVDLSAFVALDNTKPVAQQLQHAGQLVADQMPDSVYGTCHGWHANELGPTYEVGIRGTDASKMRKRSPYVRIYHRTGDDFYKVEVELKRLPSELGSANAQYAYAFEEASRLMLNLPRWGGHPLHLGQRPVKREATADETAARMAGSFLQYMLRHQRQLSKGHRKALAILSTSLGASASKITAAFDKAQKIQNSELKEGVALTTA